MDPGLAAHRFAPRSIRGTSASYTTTLSRFAASVIPV